MSKFGSLRWCLQLNDEEWAVFFTSVGKQGAEALKTSQVHTSYYSSDSADGYIRSLRKHMGSVSKYPHASGYQKYKAWKTTFKTILPLLQIMQSYGKELVPEKYTDRLKASFQVLSKWEKNQIEQTAKQKQAEGSILKELQSSFVETVAPLQKLPTGLTKPFEYIMALHTKASQLQLTAENKYFVEQVKDDYLPAIALATMRIQSASEEAQAEANKNFTEQLSLIQKRLETIIRESEQKVLADVRAQTLFLEASNKKELTA
jgi:hypothetical protein